MATSATSIFPLQQAFAAHEGFVRKRLSGLGVPARALDDATQDVFEVLVRRIADYDPERPLVPLMAGVARKVAKRHREREQRQPLALVAEPTDSRRADPERAAMAEDARRKFDRFLARLTAEQWEVFVLSELEGLKGTEISEELGVNLSTVYARLRKAKKQLRRATGPSRNWLPAWLPLLGETRRPAAVVTGAVALSIGLGMCAPIEDGSVASEVSAVEAAAKTVRGGVAAWPTDPPNAEATALRAGSVAAHAPESNDGWVRGPSGASTEGDATLSRESHTRISGDLVELRITYVGDDEVDMSRRLVTLTVDGLKILKRPPDRVDIPAGEEVQVLAEFRAVRSGVVHLRYAYGSETTDAGAKHAYVFEDGALRRCRDHECDTDAAPPPEGGDTKRVEFTNRCTEGVRFALLRAHGRPPEGTKIHAGARPRRGLARAGPPDRGDDPEQPRQRTRGARPLRRGPSTAASFADDPRGEARPRASRPHLDADGAQRRAPGLGSPRARRAAAGACARDRRRGRERSDADRWGEVRAGPSDRRDRR